MYYIYILEKQQHPTPVLLPVLLYYSSIQSEKKTRTGVDCGSDHEILIEKFRLKLKKVGKTTRPFSSVQSLSRIRSLRPHDSQHTRPPCPSPTPGVHPNSGPLSWRCHPNISFSVIPFSSCPQSLLASESYVLLKFRQTLIEPIKIITLPRR